MAVVPAGEIALALEQLGQRQLIALQVQAKLLKMIVGRLQGKHAPAQGALGKHDAQARKARQNPRHQQVAQDCGGAERTRQGLEGAAQRGRKRRVGRKLNIRRGAGVETQRHAQRLAGRPDRIVLGLVDMRQLAQVHGDGRVHHPAVSLGHRAFDLGNRCLNRIQGYQTLGDKARAGGRPLLDQPVVVGPDTGQLEGRIGQPTKSLSGQTGQAGIQHRSVHAVGVHGFQPLGRTMGERGDILPTLRQLIAISQGGARSGNPVQSYRPAINQPALAAIGLLDQVRNPFPPTLGETLGPHLGVFDHVLVAADKTESAFHPPLPA